MSCLISLCFASSEDIIQTKINQQRTDDVASNIRKQGKLIKEKKPTSLTDVIEEKSKDGKGDTGEQKRIIKQEYDIRNEDRKDTINDDLQYLSAASAHNEAGTKSQEKTTEQREDTSNQGQQKENGVNTDSIKNEEGDQHEEEEEDIEEGEQEEETAAPFDKNHKRQVVLCRGVGSLGDLLFQYATVSSIARSSKRRAIFSSTFTPLLTLFPEAPIIIIEDEEIVQLQPLTNITLSSTQISFDSVKDDIPDEGSVEIVGQTRSWKYFHVILNNLRQELSPSQLYVEAADDYLEEVMRRALKDNFKANANDKIEDDKKDKSNKNGVEHNSKGFLKYNGRKHKNDQKVKSKLENGNVKQTEDEPKSIIEQMKSPEDAITLVGIHVPVMVTDDQPEIENRERQDENTRKETKIKEKEQNVLSYFRDAMDYYRDENSISGDYVQFVIVCEHLRWCIDHLNGPGVHFAIGGSAELDLSILARCDHAILTPSSLSWWSSWLTGGQVVYPATLSEMNRVPLDDYVFPDWTEILL